ncbi:MAG: FUSC family protein [Gammaproteobacteria bacterium]
MKRSVIYAFAVFMAVILSEYFAFFEKYWTPIVAIVVMQTTIGVALRQGIQRGLVIILSVGFATYLALWVVKEPILIALLVTLAFSISCYFSMKISSHYYGISIPFIVAIFVLLSMLLPLKTEQIIYQRLYDITLGAAIGIGVNALVFPLRVDVEFRKEMVAVLNAFSNDLNLIMDLLFKKNAETAPSLSLQTVSVPEWIYLSGLSYSLRQGHRHFLIMVERVEQILFSMHHLARYRFDPVLLKDLHDPLLTFVGQAHNTLRALTTVLNLNTLKEGISDLNEEMQQLEKAFKKIVPLSLELLDMSKDYVYLAAFIQDLKDLQLTLFKLAQALR